MSLPPGLQRFGPLCFYLIRQNLSLPLDLTLNFELGWYFLYFCPQGLGRTTTTHRARLYSKGKTTSSGRETHGASSEPISGVPWWLSEASCIKQSGRRGRDQVMAQWTKVPMSKPKGQPELNSCTTWLKSKTSSCKFSDL